MNYKTKNGDKSVTKKRGSLVQSIKTFEKCIVNMGATVLVPTRLNDIDSESMVKNGVPNSYPENGNLFNVFTDLRKVSKILYGDRHHLEDNKLKNSRMDINGNNDNLNSNGSCLSLNDNLLTKFEFHAKNLKLILDELCGTAEYITGVYKDDVQNMHMNYNHIEYNNEIKHYYTSNQSKEDTD